jgi:hypothetical protein
MSTKMYYFVLLLIAAISIWLRKGMLVHVPYNATFDDLLFIRTARYLRAGDWLGPYNNLTLTKGMFYPFFICIASFAAIPLKMAEQAAYLAASGLTAEIVRRRSGKHHLAVVLFGLLAFNPVLWNVELARVIREGVYVSLSLAVVALTVVIAFRTREGDRSRRIFQGVALGLIGEAFWLTREEGIWLLPALAVVTAIALLGLLRPDGIPTSDRGVFPHRSSHVAAIALPFVVAFAVFLATNNLVKGLNYRHYGVFETSEFRAKSFLHAYGALARIQHNEWQRYMLFPKDARQRAYSVSQAARELAPFLDGQMGESWRHDDCKRVDIVPCSDVPSGWFIWELRNAVSLAGQYGSAVEAMRFYDRLANEIDAACARGNIDCLPPRATLSPPFRREYLGGALGSVKATARAMFTLGDGQVGTAVSDGSRRGVKDFSDIIVGDVYPSTLVVQGWTAAVSAPPTIQLRGRDAAPTFTSLAILPALDIGAAYPDFKTMRFRLETDCPLEACDLILAEPGGQFDQVPMAQLSPGARFNTGGALLTIEAAFVPATARPTESAQVKVARILALGYATAFPFLAIFGAVGLLSATFFRKRHSIPASILALALGSLVAVVTRIGLLAYIDATSFPATTVLYSSPASPFVIIFTVLGIYAGSSFALEGIGG